MVITPDTLIVFSMDHKRLCMLLYNVMRAMNPYLIFASAFPVACSPAGDTQTADAANQYATILEAPPYTPIIRTESGLPLHFEPGTEPDLPAVPVDMKDSVRHFPTEAAMAGPTPDLATYDAIVLRDGCFFIDEEGEDDPLAMFPFGIGLHRDEEGYMAFRPRNSAQAQRLARVGTRMQLGYRQAVAKPPPELIEACGSHPVVAVKALDQAAGYGVAWVAVQENAAREGLSAAEALRRANDCLLEQERVLTEIRLRRKLTKPQPCYMTIRIPPPPPAVANNRP